ncbi:uncharacterized protein LOC131661483 [Vicia villosa]|uniref:uncharacterized protein LOC131661483 n=1 Tax=Vicia villosa TaxID=3911 RepID=UPI00273B4493|nr:uncharacterized protein LOC131661483 [Vicia villosa]
MSLNFVQPKNILATLKRNEPDNISNIRQVYNQRYCNKKASRGDRSEMQHLLKMLDDNKYVVLYRNFDDEVTVRDIFWTHPDSMKLFNTFSTVLLLDSTYKPNKYQLPSFEMVGVTSTKKTFAVGFDLLECENEENFRWALEVKPAVGTKQIATEGGKVVKPGVIVDQIMDAWACIASSSIKELFANAVLQFQKICEKYPDLLKYIESTVLDKVKEKFVCAWIDKVRHLGNTTTNKVESTHWLCDSKGDLCKARDTINHMILNQHNEIQTSLGQSITILEHRFKNNILYSQLIGNVFRAGLNYIFYEAKQGETIGGNSAKCGCTITITYGLPCACAIAEKVRLGQPITMNEIIPHWKKLTFDDDGCVEEDSNISIISELEAIQERFSKAGDNTKLYIKEQLRRIGFLETVDMKPLSQPVKTKGAPKKVKSTPNDNRQHSLLHIVSTLTNAFPTHLLRNRKNLKRVQTRELA